MMETASHGRLAIKTGTHRRLPWRLRLLRRVFAGLGPFIPGPMGSWAYRLWFRTRHHPTGAAEREAATRAVRSRLSLSGVPVAVYRWGAGPPVVFMHGWSGRATQVVHFIEPLVQAGFQVVAFDAPAHGETPGRRTTIFQCAAALAAVVRECGTAPGILTHSFGGMVLAYALRQGMLAGRVVCVNAPASLDFLLESFSRTLALPGAVNAVLRHKLEQRFGGNLAHRISTETNVRALTVPALIIHDRDDRDVPWQQGARIAVAWPGARFYQTSGLGHRRILRDSATIQAVVEFFSAQENNA